MSRKSTDFAVAVIGLVLAFKTSDSLAGAYGVAVSTTMLATTTLVGVVARYIWGWSLLRTGIVISFFFIVDATFFSANLIKIFEGGYILLLVGAAIFSAMTTWRKGRMILFDRIARDNPRYDEFWEEMHCANMPRVPGVAIYLTSCGDRVPSSLS